MAKRGRPKLNRPRVDYGTPELIKRRMTISPRDATLSTSPLDVLKSRGHISDEAFSAALYFAGIRKRMFGKAIPPVLDLTAISGGPSEFDDIEAARAEKEYRDACFAMKTQGRASFDAVENLVVHERFPDWLIDPTGGTQFARQKRFMLGLAALLGWFKNKDRRVAA